MELILSQKDFYIHHQLVSHSIFCISLLAKSIAHQNTKTKSDDRYSHILTTTCQGIQL
jgi:hypothetical protein